MNFQSIFSLFSQHKDLPVQAFCLSANLQGEILKFDHRVLESLHITEPLKVLSDIFFEDSLKDAQKIIQSSFSEPQWLPYVILKGCNTPFFIFFLREQQDITILYAIHFTKSNMIELLDSMEKFHSYEKYSKDMIITLSQDGLIKDINRFGFHFLGYRKEELMGHSFTDILISPSSTHNLVERLERNKVVNNLEICLKGKTSDIIGLAFMFGVWKSENQVSYILLFIRNITEQVELLSQYMRTSMELSIANEELKQTQLTLVNQEKMASVGLLAAGLAHEINNPLGYIYNNIKVLEDYFRSYDGFVEECRQSFIDDEKKEEAFKRITDKYEIPYILNDLKALSAETNQGISRIQKLLESLKIFSQKEMSGISDYYDINESLESIIDLTYNEYKYSVEIRKNYGKTPMVYCHIMSINQAIFNVFMNAVEAVREARSEGGGWIQISTFQEEDFIYIQLKDNGGGIPEDAISHVKDPFFTTKKTGEGTGLGLSLAYEIIVEKHGGKLVVENINEGASVSIGLPVVTDIEEEL